MGDDMKIKFKKTFRVKAGDIPAGKEVEINDDLAKGYIKNGYAVSVEKPKPVRSKKTNKQTKQSN